MQPLLFDNLESVTTEVKPEFDYGDLDTDTLRNIYPDAPLFGESTEGFHVQQGAIGNCGTIASSAAFAESGDLMEKSIESLGEGYYAVRFAQGIKVKWVLIDDSVPVNQRGFPAYCKPVNPEAGIWPSLLEKARATVLGGSYAQITNHPVEEYKADAAEWSGWFPNVQEAISDFDRVLEVMRDGGYAVFSFPSQLDEDEEPIKIPGIVTGHAFAAYDAERLEMKDGTTHDLIQIENPLGWSAKDYHGEFSEDSEIWRQVENSDRFLSQSESGGSFWVTWSELLDLKRAESIRFNVLLPQDGFPVVKEIEQVFGDENRTPHKWPSLAAIQKAQAPITIVLKESGTLKIEMSWKKRIGKKQHSYMFLVGEEETYRSKYAWHGRRLQEVYELEAGTYQLFPAIVHQPTGEGVARLVLQSSVPLG